MTLPGLGRKWRHFFKSGARMDRAPAVGAVAQLGERLVRNEEVSGSIPLSSTTLRCSAASGGRPTRAAKGALRSLGEGGLLEVILT